jgi:hypothetical protein
MKYQHCPVLLLAVVGIGACTIPGSRSITSAPNNSDWNEIIARAASADSYGGYYVERGTLWLGFTEAPEMNLKQISEKPTVRAFLARHTDDQLKAALSNIMAYHPSSMERPIAAAINYKDSIIEISSVAPLAGEAGPLPRCSALQALPRRDAKTMVQVIDSRDCKR